MRSSVQDLFDYCVEQKFIFVRHLIEWNKLGRIVHLYGCYDAQEPVLLRDALEQMIAADAAWRLAGRAPY